MHFAIRALVLRVFPAIAAVVPFALASPAAAVNCGASPQAGVNWQDCRKRNLMLDGVDLSRANLVEADFSSTDLRDTKLAASDFSKAALARAMLDNSDAAGANFEKALGYRTSFVNANLENANFNKAEMQRADFTDAVLTSADFEKSELGRVNFSGADINGTNFDYANLARADFRAAKFDTPIAFAGAYLYQTRIEGVDLSQATGLMQWQIDLACGDAATKLPQGLEAPAGWPCIEEE
jgi:uncharacterized protein YjbI with pentapeptide repeats